MDRDPLTDPVPQLPNDFVPNPIGLEHPPEFLEPLLHTDIRPPTPKSIPEKLTNYKTWRENLDNVPQLLEASEEEDDDDDDLVNEATKIRHWIVRCSDRQRMMCLLLEVMAMKVTRHAEYQEPTDKEYVLSISSFYL